jgi:hypothetical protein
LKISRTLAKLAVCILPLAGLVSLYQTLFTLWMCAHPVYQSQEWQTRFYIRLSTTVVIVALWLFADIWLLRRRRG